MSLQLLQRIERFRQQRKLSILALCRMMEVHNVTYHRWKNAGKITGAYKKIVEDFLEKNKKSSFAAVSKASNAASSLNKTSDIAVIGAACYYPGASNIKELWENILSRRIQFRRMLDQRLPLSEYYDDDAKAPEKTYLIKAAFLENFLFDWGKLRIPKKTVESTDIAHWLALDIALKTFEDAGYKLNEIPLQNTGVIVGNTLTGEQTRSQSLRLRWPYVQKALNTTAVHLGMGIEERSRFAGEMEQIYKSAFYPITEDSLAGGLANTIAGRICNYLDLKGGGYIVDGACSSSLLAVATAADALKMGNMDLVLAGGVDISLDPFELVGFAKVGALARDKMSVYDQSANGFLPGEGCGFILLKRLEDAIKDKNYIYAIIKGWGISSDGRGGIMEPSSSGQSFAIGRAYKGLKYKIGDVDFVEGHGTGTTKGDKVELEGIAMAIEQSASKENKNIHKCGVTSFKSIVGHTKAAAGIGGLIKSVLAVNQRILPPTASCTNPNEVFKDKAKNLYPLIQGEVLSPTKIARAGISSAGFGGINCHITVESYDKPKEEIRPKIDASALFVSQQQSEIFVFTSRTIIHLKKVIEKFKKDLRNISIAEMADLAAFLNKKAKPHLPIKAAIVTDSPEYLYDALVLLEQDIDQTSVEEGQIHRIKAKDPGTQIILSNAFKKNRIGFLYPGQGSQRLNMTRVLTQRFKWARDLLDLSKLPLSEHIYKAVDQFFTKEETQEFEKQLSDTRITQPAIVASSLIWTEFLSQLNIEPESVAGHSLGELTAFYKAGAFDKNVLIKFAQLRGALMVAKGRSAGGMVSLFCSKQKVEELIAKIKGNILLANINSPSQMIASGGNKEIEKIIELAKKEDISTFRLNASNAFHSSLMKSASKKIRSSKVLPDVFKPSSIKVYSGMSPVFIDGKINVREYFSKQVIFPVNFIGLVETISKECDLLIEVGPGRVLTDLVKAINKGQGPLCLPVESTAQNDRDLNIVLAELFVRSVPVKWEELYKNRLIRIFVPASRKKFIENQCEHPLKIGNQILKSESLQIPAQAIKVAQQNEEVIPGGLPEAVKGKDNIVDLLIDLAQQITGFDKGSINLNSKLLDDLNLDSIKAAELIGKAARLLGIGGQVDPSKFSNNTLGEIGDQLNELASQANAGSREELVSDILRRYHDKIWVRNFVFDLKLEEIKTKNVNQLKELKNIVFLSEENEPLVDKIADQFKTIKAKTAKIYYNDSIGKISQVDCLIAISPRKKQAGDLNNDSFKEIIKKAHKIVDLAYSNQMNKDAFVVVVQFAGGIASSCFKSIVSTLYLERSELKVRIIDFDARTSEKEIASRVIDELQTYERFNVVEYDSKVTRKVGFYNNSQPSGYKKRNILWSIKDVILVTGGAKGITAQCALEFARATKAQIVLMGRSALPTDKKDENNEIVQTLNQFEREHLKVSYYQCDVADEKNVASVIKEIEQSKGKITGFIHGAGLNSLKRLTQLSINEALSESLPKVMGAVNVCQALSDSSLKLIVGITSIIGMTGMEGSGWYGLSNEILNLYLQQFKHEHPKTQITTVAYSIWDAVGMGAKLGSVNRLAEKGIEAIPVAEGVKRFRQLVEGNPGAQQVIVAARLAGLDTWKIPTLKANHFRFIEEIKYFMPNVELIVQAQLNVKDDPYLLDHNWKGALLFPFVFGLEAMTQAVVQVLGLTGLDYIKAKNIELQRPIPVPEEAGATIEIHAQVLEKASNNSNVEVKVEIYSQDSAYKESHFSAIFEIDKQIPVENVNKNFVATSKNILDIDPQTGLYGPILFQGKMFQYINKVHELVYNVKTRKGRALVTALREKLIADSITALPRFNNFFLIGDPFLIDSALQAMQLIIPQDLSLPRKIAEMDIVLPNQIKENKKYIISSEIFKVSNEQGIGNAGVFCGDRFILGVKNCDLKILQTIPERPSAYDLVNPTLRDQKIIEDKLRELSQEIGYEAPVIRCLYDNRLVNAKKDHRHKIETPLIKAAVAELLKRDKRPAEKFKIGWQKNGKPIVFGNVKDVGVSVSHDGAFLLVVAGHGDQGCDVESIIKKTDREWLALLGKPKHRILRTLVENGFDFDFAGTTVWGAEEVAKKMNLNGIRNAVLNTRNNRFAIFSCDKEEGQFVSVDLVLSQGRRKLFSFYLKQGYRHDYIYGDSLSNRFGYNDSVFRMRVEEIGPGGGPVYIKRFPVTFKNIQRKGKSVYFSNYFDWMGTVREYGLQPVMENILKFTAGNQWGIATNSVKLRIFRELYANDVVEVRFWMTPLYGKSSSTFNLMFEWFQATPQGEIREIAVSEQKLSWIRIIGHGEASVENMPEEIKGFLESMISRDNAKFYKKFIRKESLGRQIEILHKRHSGDLFLSEQAFNTTLEDSNLVGNIYFSNYEKWLGRVEDLFFYKLMAETPSLYQGGEFYCFSCDVEHIKEAMPFDRIIVKMFLSKIYEKGIELFFRFFVSEKNGTQKLIATANQRIAWIAKMNSRVPVYERLPEEIKINLSERRNQ